MLGYINYKNHIELSSNQFVQGFPKLTKVDNFVFDMYQFGKLKHTFYKKVDNSYTLKPL